MSSSFITTLLLVPLAMCALGTRAAVSVAAAEAPYPFSQQPTGSCGPLYVIADAKLSPGNVVTYETLSGGLARQCPRLYRVSNDVNDTSDSYAVWLSQLVKRGVQTNTTYLNDFPGLLKMMRSSIQGYVLFSDGTESVNAALTFCAGTPASGDGAVMVAVSDPATEQLLSSLGVPMAQNLTAAKVIDVYKQLRDNFNHRLISFQPPSKDGTLAGYAVFGQFPTVEYQGDTGGDTARMIVSDMSATKQQCAAMGWGPETQYVSTLGKSNVYVHASDFTRDMSALTNLAVHASASFQGSLKRQRSLRHGTPHSAPMRNDDSESSADDDDNDDVHTVAFVMTDGDNIQWLLNDWFLDEKWFGSSLRGSFPMGWTLSPALASLAPVVMQTFYDAASPNDSFVTGPSGVGYIYPTIYNDMDAFGDLTGQYLEKSNLSVVNVIDQTATITAQTPLVSLDQTDALLLYTGQCYAGGHGQNVIYLNKPVIQGRSALWGDNSDPKHPECLDVDGLVALLKTLPKSRSDPNGYSVIPVHAWSHNMSDVARVVQALQAAGGFDVLTPEDLVARFKSNIIAGAESCPATTGSYADSCGSCTLSSDCILTCTCDGPNTQPSSCNVKCINGAPMSNNEGTLSYDGGKPCPQSC